jgi:NADH:ubiquinone reductase (non-electrogenic)
MTTLRAYPLFLAEKAAEIGEKIVSDIRDEHKYPLSGKKEKVVVLGTGWGAASFLKGIDTNLYDVTIVSPRNYFLFTPMLAGASVGTVEYRSITEPVREVRIKPQMSFCLCVSTVAYIFVKQRIY